MACADPCKRLPLELLAAIFSYLPVTSVWLVQIVSRTWHKALTTEDLLTSALRRWETHDVEDSARGQQPPDLRSRLTILKNHRLGKPMLFTPAWDDPANSRMWWKGASVLKGRYLAYFHHRLNVGGPPHDVYLTVRDLLTQRSYSLGQYTTSRNENNGGCLVTISSKLLAFTVQLGKLHTFDLHYLETLVDDGNSELSSLVQITCLTNESMVTMLYADQWHVVLLHEFNRLETFDRITIYDHAESKLKHYTTPLPTEYSQVAAWEQRSRPPTYVKELYDPERAVYISATDKTCTLLHYINDYQQDHTYAGTAARTHGTEPILHSRGISFDGEQIYEKAVPYSVQDHTDYRRHGQANLSWTSSLHLRPAGGRNQFCLAITARTGISHQLLLSFDGDEVEIDAVYAYSSNIALAFWKGQAYMNTSGRLIRRCRSSNYQYRRWRTRSWIYPAGAADKSESDHPRAQTRIDDILINESYMVLFSSGPLRPGQHVQTFDMFTFDASLAEHEQKLLEQHGAEVDVEYPKQYCWSDRSNEEAITTCPRSEHG